MKKEEQKQHIKDIMKTDEDSGLYEPSVNYDDERFDLSQQAWVNHIPKTDDEMWLQAMCNDIWAKWQSDSRVLIQKVRSEKLENEGLKNEKVILSEFISDLTHEKKHYESLAKQQDIELRELKESIGWKSFEEEKPKVGQDILIVWPSGNFTPEFRRLTADELKHDWSLMHWLPIPKYK